MRLFLTVSADTRTPNSVANFLAISVHPTFSSVWTKFLMNNMSLDESFDGLPARGLF